MFGFLNDSAQVNKKGIGLGLMISNKLVVEFGGKINVHSKLGKGSKFTFTIKLEDTIKTEQHEIGFKNQTKFVFKWVPEGNMNKKIKYTKVKEEILNY